MADCENGQRGAAKQSDETLRGRKVGLRRKFRLEIDTVMREDTLGRKPHLEAKPFLEDSLE